jgi:hypothetical protein
MPLQEALIRLVPKVRPRFHHEALAFRDAAAPPVFRPLAGSLALSLVVDFPDCELDVGPRELEAWGADFDVLLQRARANLLLRGGEERFKAVRPGLFRSTWEDGLDGSRILLPGVLQGLPLRGRPVAVAPDRDTLLVAGSEDPQALAWLLEGALDFVGQDPRSVNACPVRWTGYQWEPWEAVAEHPAAPLLVRALRRRLLEEYASQKALLDRRHARMGRDVIVAPFLLERDCAGAVTSRTYLAPEAGEGWLPEADLVGLPAGPGETAGHWVPWPELRDRLGSRLQPLGLFPERYRLEAMTA